MSNVVTGLLLGDAAGVGPEIVAKLLTGKALKHSGSILLLGDETVLKNAFRLIDKSAPYRLVTQEEIGREDGVALLHMDHPYLEKVVPGQVNCQCGQACITLLEKAVALYQAGKVHAICYAPLNKAAMQAADPSLKSELHLLVRLLDHRGTFGEINMLDNVWTTRVTSHIPLSQVSARLTREATKDHILLLHKTLRTAGFAFPRIGVSALNPHAGEGGRCGTEEIDIIVPAMEDARRAGVESSGPYPADILFIKAFAGELDGGVTMYHDQGQIALKLKGFERGVTIGGGLGLPVTTCAHGTAFDIVGKGIASASSLANAIRMAGKMAEAFSEV